ncbi:MAG: bifunctional nuclease family protein [Candidatus Aenigmarchaeota archaeon]|nr:bifunctional nuclease family protein [Candidatus Aenigmarchaeota archaeon]
MEKSEIFLVAAGVLIMIGIVVVAQYYNVDAYIKADKIEVQGQTVTVGANCKGIVADTSEERAQSIKDGIDGKISDRPNSHDIYVETLKSFNITIENLLFEDFDGTTYKSFITVKNNEKVLKIDSRPSDGIAIALRAKAPILVKKQLLEKYGKDIC